MDGLSVSCPSCSLAGQDFSGHDLTNANLAHADLRGARFQGTILDGAILIGANLEGADLTGARLNTSARGPADLARANLAGASLRNAVLQGATLLFAGLQGTDFTSADLTGARLGPQPKTGTHSGRQTSFRNATLERRFLPSATTADLEGVQWSEPKLAVSLAATPDGIACGNSDVSTLPTIVYVSTQGTDGSGCGVKPSQACQTIAYGVSRCVGNACNVLVMYGEYSLQAPLALNATSAPHGVHLYGGCLPQGQADQSYRSLIDAPAGGVPAVSVDTISPVVLENFKLLGSVATGNQGAPAMTLTVTGGAVVTLTNSEVLGGTGAPGAAGANQITPGQKGGDANGGAAGTNSGCPDTQGGGGAGQMPMWFSGTDCGNSCEGTNCSGTPGALGQTNASAFPGGPGQIDVAACPPVHPQGGGPGGPGANGGCGSGGAAAVNTQGSFSGVVWTPASGQSGTPGLNAGGGGGGGSGGGACGFCVLVPWTYNGGSGGGGGAGGCGGAPGGGGQQGGGSFALVVAASTLSLNQTRVVAGRGGDGGSGGAGAAGGGGGAHAGGAWGSGPGSNYQGGLGGPGGDGGAGGGGGGGAGGNGGPSVGVALVGGATVAGTGLVYYNGTSGNVGGPGEGGTGVACAVGPGGQPGQLGLVASTATYAPIFRGWSTTSGNYLLILQQDGNLCVYESGQFLWGSIQAFSVSPYGISFLDDGTMQWLDQDRNILKQFTGTKGNQPPYTLALEVTGNNWEIVVIDNKSSVLYQVPK
jgi:uncharacterized protein YjbI with pentapeptide repeats